MKRLFGISMVPLLLLIGEADAQWTRTDIRSDAIHRLAAVDSVIIAACDSGLLISRDKGLSWQRGGLESRPFGALTFHGADLYAASYAGGVYRSTDHAGSWDTVGALIGSVLSMTSNGGYLIVGTSYGVRRYSYVEQRWIPTHDTLPGAIYEIASRDSNLFATMWQWINGFEQENQGVFMSSDQGDTWVRRDSQLYVPAISVLLTHGDNIYAGGGYWLYNSGNDGVSWNSIAGGIPGPMPSVCAMAVSNSRLFLGTDHGVFVSTDSGANWTPFNTGLPDTIVTSLTVTPDTPAVLIAGLLYSGLWRRPVSEIFTTAADPAPQRPYSTVLRQNFPNPFNPATTISYSLGAPGHVRLTIFDLLGREVRVMFDGIEGPGNRIRIFDGAGLASGVYYVRLETNSYVATNRLVLMR